MSSSGLSPFELSFRRSVKHRFIAPIGAKGLPLRQDQYDEGVEVMLELVKYLYKIGIIYNGIKLDNLIYWNDKILVTNFKEVSFESIDRMIPYDQLDPEAKAGERIQYQKCLVWTIGLFIKNVYRNEIPDKYVDIVNNTLVPRSIRIPFRALNIKAHNTEHDKIILNTYAKPRGFEDHSLIAKLWLEHKVPSEVIMLMIKLYWNYASVLEPTNDRVYIIFTLMMYSADILLLRKKIDLNYLIEQFRLNSIQLHDYYKTVYVKYFLYLTVHHLRIVAKNEVKTLDTIGYLISRPHIHDRERNDIRKHLGYIYFNRPIPNRIYIPTDMVWLIKNHTIHPYVTYNPITN